MECWNSAAEAGAGDKNVYLVHYPKGDTERHGDLGEKCPGRKRRGKSVFSRRGHTAEKKAHWTWGLNC